MFSILTNILAFILTVFLIVTVHEWGHYIVARWCGIKVLKFSIGFGRPIWKRISKSGVEVAVGWIPLGGYVKLLDSREGEVKELEKHLAFDSALLWKRFLVVIAGPVLNILLAVIAFFMMYTVGLEVLKPITGHVVPESIVAKAGIRPGFEIVTIDDKKTNSWQDVLFNVVSRIGEKNQMTIRAKAFNTNNSPTKYYLDLSNWALDEFKPTPIHALGLYPYQPIVEPVIDEVVADGPGSKYGLKAGDKIIRVDGRQVVNWLDLHVYIQKSFGNHISLDVLRDGQVKSLDVVVDTRKDLFTSPYGYIGIKVKQIDLPDEYKVKLQAWPPYSLVKAVDYTFRITNFNYLLIGKLITGKLSFHSLGGPISIFQTSSMAFRQGVAVFLSYLGFLSIMLAVVNTLPVPGLDGGHLLMFVIEAIICRPVPIRWQLLLYRLGMIAIIVLFVHATINDVTRILTS